MKKRKCEGNTFKWKTLNGNKLLAGVASEFNLLQGDRESPPRKHLDDNK